MSVIVPVYNAQQYLPKCLGSICSQTYKNLQIILVNDGSRDGSLQVCQRYAKKDSRIEIIDNENHGVSFSRNAGIAAARGKYIQFADSDDYLPDNATEAMVEGAEDNDSDMVIAPYYRVTENKIKYYNLLGRPKRMEKDKLLKQLVRRPGSYFWGVVWNKLFRTDIVKEKNIRFYEDVNLSEDFLFNLDFIQYAERFTSVDTPVYFYVKNKESLSSHWLAPVEFMKLRQRIFINYEALFKQLGIYEDYKFKLYKYYISTTGHR